MNKKIAIIGSGISGLSAAWYLARKGHFVTVFEKSDKLAGCIDSVSEKDFFFERGPRSFNTRRSPYLLSLIEDLKLKDDIIYSANCANTRYLLSKEKLKAIPQTLFSLVFSKLTRRHLFALLKEPFKEKKLLQDETIFDFVKRRFNKAIALQFFDPITTGIYGGDIKDLSVHACFFDLVKFERQYGSVVKGILLKKNDKKNKCLKPLFTLRGGIIQIANKIASTSNIDVHIRYEIETIIENKYNVEIVVNRRLHRFDYAIVATPYHALKKLFPRVPFDFPSIEYNRLTVINVGFHAAKLLPKGFGYLVPRIENEKLLGCIFDSNIFLEQNKLNQSRLTFMTDEDFQKNDPKIFVKDILKRHLKINKTADYIYLNTFKHAIAQFNVGHKEKILRLSNSLEKYFSRIYFTGNYFESVSINGCIKKSKEIVIKLENIINL